MLSAERICAALLLCGYCAFSMSANCPDFSDIDFCDNDRDRLQVSFGECDSFVTPHNSRREPVVKYDNANADKKYVLVMVDPDAPSRRMQTYKWWRHWLLTDIPGWSLLSQNSQRLTGNSVTDYMGPSPPEHTGNHRYQLMLFEQHESDVEPVLDDGVRRSWNLNEFVRTNNLCRRLVATFEFFSANEIN